MLARRSPEQAPKQVSHTRSTRPHHRPARSLPCIGLEPPQLWQVLAQHNELEAHRVRSVYEVVVLDRWFVAVVSGGVLRAYDGRVKQSRGVHRVASQSKRVSHGEIGRETLRGLLLPVLEHLGIERDAPEKKVDPSHNHGRGPREGFSLGLLHLSHLSVERFPPLRNLE